MSLLPPPEQGYPSWEKLVAVVDAHAEAAIASQRSDRGRGRGRGQPRGERGGRGRGGASQIQQASNSTTTSRAEQVQESTTRRREGGSLLHDLGLRSRRHQQQATSRRLPLTYSRTRNHRRSLKIIECTISRPGIHFG